MEFQEKIRIKLGEVTLGSLMLAERTIKGHCLNLFSEEFAENPQAEFAKARHRGPLYWSLSLRAWWATSFEIVREILRDPRFSNDVRQFPKRADRVRRQIGRDAERLERFENPSMLNLDPPNHTRIRRLATHAFMSKYINSLAPRIEQIVEDCLARISNESRFDLMDNLAKPLPAIVIAEMMGLPQEDHDQFQAWSEDLIRATSGSGVLVQQQGQDATRALLDYFKRIIEEQRGQANDDLIGQLMAAAEDGDKLNAQELYNTCLLLLVAGHETTTRLIGNGMYWLLQHPEQLALLRAEPQRMETAVEEMLRFESPVVATQRFVLEDMEFHGQQLKRGDSIFIGLATANRDPAANDDPDVFDITREKPQQVSFGYGIHLCIGASLARLEARIAFTRLLERFPQLALAEPPQWGRNPFFRGFDELHLSTKVEESAVH